MMIGIFLALCVSGEVREMSQSISLTNLPPQWMNECNHRSLQLFCSNLEWISLSLQLNHHWCSHAGQGSINTQSSSTPQEDHLICRALVPNTRALSYLVMNGVVVRSLAGIA